MKKVFVTGAAGFVGSHVARLLVERGDEVAVLVRPSSNTRLIDELPIRVVRGDLTDRSSLDGLLAGVDELYHVAADYRLWARDPEELYRNNVEGTRNILEAAMSEAVGRVIYTSTVGCLGLPAGDVPGNEQTPVKRSDLVGHYKKSKYDAEQVAVQYARSGLDTVIVSPSTPVGPGDVKPTPTGKTILDFLKGRMPAYVDTGLNLIAVEDVAAGHLLAAERGKPGEKYILGNRNVTLREILGILAQVTGRPSPSMRVGHGVALAVAYADNFVARIIGHDPSIPIEGVLMSRKKMYFSSQKAVNELGLPQSSIESALERAAIWFVDNGYVKAPA